MNKRLISLLLVVMMVFTLLPMTALAKGEGTGDVAVIVYGKAISEAFWAEETVMHPQCQLYHFGRKNRFGV